MGDAPIVDSDLKVNTTKAKIRVLRTLQGYWRVKGKFLQNKLDPTYGPAHPEFYREIAEYISEYTDLPQQSTFWNALSEERRDALCRGLVFSDEVPTKFSIPRNGGEAGAALGRIYIVLNGYASVESSLNSGVRIMHGQGQTFGHYHPFDALTRFEIAGRPTYDPLVAYSGPDETLDIVVEKGALLQISMGHFAADVWGHLPPEPEGDSYVDTRSDFEISGIAAEALTEADLSCIKVHRVAKRRLAGVLYDFMSSFDLLPKNAQVASSAGYLRRGDKGSQVFVNANTVYVVLDGTLKLQIAKTGADAKPGALGTHTIDGDDTVVEGIKVKMHKLPIVSLDVGSMALVRDECFTVGQDSATLPSGAMKPQFRAVLEQARAAAHPTYPAAQPAAPKRDKKGRVVPEVFRTDILYQLSLFFDKTVIYLEIPEVKFRMAMEECPPATAEAFSAQLGHFNDTTFARIVKLLPWIQGGTFGVHVSAHERVMRADEEASPEGEYAGIGFRGSHDDMLDTSLKGSFKHITMLGTYDDEPTRSDAFLTSSAPTSSSHEPQTATITS